MSPEVLEGATEFTPFAFQQIDVYAAALVVWEVMHRTEVQACVEHEPDGLPPARLPFEDEIGITPTLGRIREVVVVGRYRPQVRDCLSMDPVSFNLTNHVSEK